MRELYLVRHGRTAWNHAGRFQGQTDVPLDTLGRAQAAAAARSLQRVAFDRIVSSDLRRAADTAAEIARGRGVAVEFEPRLRETNFGAWEGLTWAEILVRYPQAAEAAWHDPRNRFPNGGESFGDVVIRVRAVLDELRAAPAGAVCAVAHAGVIHAALQVLFSDSSPSLGMRLEAACISRIAFSNGAAEVVTLNDVAHLAELPLA